MESVLSKPLILQLKEEVVKFFAEEGIDYNDEDAIEQLKKKHNIE